jgi:hypothetical protein
MGIVSISTLEFDIHGSVAFGVGEDSDLMQNSRRITRRATLDGGCSIVDQGFSHGDRKLDIRTTSITRDEFDVLWHIFKTYSIINVALKEGCFRAAIQSVRKHRDTTTLLILVKEKLS